MAPPPFIPNCATIPTIARPIHANGTHFSSGEGLRGYASQTSPFEAAACAVLLPMTSRTPTSSVQAPAVAVPSTMTTRWRLIDASAPAMQAATTSRGCGSPVPNRDQARCTSSAASAAPTNATPTKYARMRMAAPARPPPMATTSVSQVSVGASTEVPMSAPSTNP